MIWQVILSSFVWPVVAVWLASTTPTTRVANPIQRVHLIGAVSRGQGSGVRGQEWQSGVSDACPLTADSGSCHGRDADLFRKHGGLVSLFPVKCFQFTA